MSDRFLISNITTHYVIENNVNSSLFSASGGVPCWRQTTLSIENGSWSLIVPPRATHHTLAPHRIARTVVKPTFSTDHPELTSFLRFPSGIRDIIYRLLVQANLDVSRVLLSVDGGSYV